jgi:hypothetical protein
LRARCNRRAQRLCRGRLGLDKAGINIVSLGDVTDDDLLNGMGDEVLGIVTAHFYSADHSSPTNKAFVEAFEKANNGMRPNFMAVSGYDGMHLIYEALKKTGGDTDGTRLVAAMKGMKWESPRGPIMIDPDTRDVVHNVYICKVEKKNGQLGATGCLRKFLGSTCLAQRIVRNKLRPGRRSSRRYLPTVPGKRHPGQPAVVADQRLEARAASRDHRVA